MLVWSSAPQVATGNRPSRVQVLLNSDSDGGPMSFGSNVLILQSEANVVEQLRFEVLLDYVIHHVGRDEWALPSRSVPAAAVISTLM